MTFWRRHILYISDSAMSGNEIAYATILGMPYSRRWPTSTFVNRSSRSDGIDEILQCTRSISYHVLRQYQFQLIIKKFPQIKQYYNQGKELETFEFV